MTLLSPTALHFDFGCCGPGIGSGDTTHPGNIVKHYNILSNGDTLGVTLLEGRVESSTFHG